METPRDDEKFSAVSFAPHVARGLIRNQATRRKVMGIALVIAVTMVIVGSTVLRAPLNPKEHVGFFLLFWLACAWMTLTVLLLAIFDVLMVRVEARAAKKAFREHVIAGDSIAPHATGEGDARR